MKQNQETGRTSLWRQKDIFLKVESDTIKQIARVSEQISPPFTQRMEDINKIARKAALREYSSNCRIWEYPWVLHHLEQIKGRPHSVLDVGSEISPIAWYLAVQGFNVIVSDMSPGYWPAWRRAKRMLGVNIERRILDAQNLNLPTASVDIYLSISVIEHIPEKHRAIEEAARVLRPGGLLIMTFDICEPDFGMTFPEWNGRALTMNGFDDMFRHSPWFDPKLPELPWNVGDIPEYLAWNRTTAPHHNYIVGAAVARRCDRAWQEPRWRDYVRMIKGARRTGFGVAGWYLNQKLVAIRWK